LILRTLLVTFHGGKGGVNNIYGYSTKSDITHPQTKTQTKQALSVPAIIELDELRGLSVSKQFICDQLRREDRQYSGLPGTSADRPAIRVPRYGNRLGSIDRASVRDRLQSPTICYVSKPDSNVVAQITLTTGAGGTVSGSLGAGTRQGSVRRRLTIFRTAPLPPCRPEISLELR
jgi:hypothetical protein